MLSLRRWVSRKLQRIIVSATVSVAAFGLVVGQTQAVDAAPRQVDPAKYSSIVVDTATGKVLYEASPDVRRFPASLTKMMTLYVMFEELDRGRFKMSTPLRVSALAQRQSPTKLGLRAGETVSVEDAVKGLITRSANDAAVVIAENVAGSVPAFADRMTRTARAIGMNNTHFNNPNGLPDPSNYSTARDLMKLGVALQVRFPQYYPLFSIKSYSFRGRFIGNHNNLLGRIDGVDGIKTGYVNASGFNIVTSVKRDGRKIVAVVMGGKTAAQRDSLVADLVSDFLPRASQARGYDGDLVAAVRSAPKIAGAPTRPAEPAVPLAAMAEHPNPVARPTIAAVTDLDDRSPDPAAPIPPADVANVAPTPPPAEAPKVVAMATPAPETRKAMPMPTSLATATLPASLVNARLPSSAAEAFSDVAPSARPDPMAQLLENTTPPRPYQVASAETPNVRSDVRAPLAPESATASVPRDRRKPANGWFVQVGTAGSERAAMELLSRARSAVGGPLTRAEPLTEAVTKGGRTVVRARFAGFADEKTATQVCNTLKKKSFSCFPLRL